MASRAPTNIPKYERENSWIGPIAVTNYATHVSPRPSSSTLSYPSRGGSKVNERIYLRSISALCVPYTRC